MSTERSEPANSNPRVLIDATGLGTLSPEIDSDLIELARAAGRTRDDVVVVCRPRDAKLFKSFDLEVHRAPDRIRTERSRRLWIDWGLPRLARSVGATVIHSPHGVFPIVTRLGRVVAVRQTNGSGDRTRRVLSAIRADVTVPSDSIADEIRDATGLPANRVHLAHLGVSKDRTAIPNWEAVESVSDLYGVTEWIALLASDDNLDSVETFRDGFRRATEFSGHRPALIVLGVAESAAVSRLTELVDNGFDVRIVSVLDDAERSALIGGSLFTVVLDDSRETGRALLDALACGAAVVARNTAVHREIAADAVEYADDTPAAVEIAVTGLLNNPDRRRSLATAAVTRSHAFSWESSLKEHRAAWTRASLRA